MAPGGRQDAVMRFEHVPGDDAFVDYAGKTIAVVDRHTREIQVAEVFVAALGASNYTGRHAWNPHSVSSRMLWASIPGGFPPRSSSKVRHRIVGKCPGNAGFAAECRGIARCASSRPSRCSPRTISWDEGDDHLRRIGLAIRRFSYH